MKTPIMKTIASKPNYGVTGSFPSVCRALFESKFALKAISGCLIRILIVEHF
jgi:hypothetical protein